MHQQIIKNMVHKYNGSRSTTNKNEICRKIKFAEKSVQLENISLSKVNPGSNISLYADPGFCYLNDSKWIKAMKLELSLFGEPKKLP